MPIVQKTLRVLIALILVALSGVVCGMAYAQGGVIPTDPTVNRVNYALASYGTTASGGSGSGGFSAGALIDGLASSNSTYQGFTISAGQSLVINLGTPRTISSLRFSLWDGDDRFYRYRVERSLNGVDYTTLLDKTTGEHRGLQEEEFPPVSMQYLKISGTFNSANGDFHLYNELLLIGDAPTTPEPMRQVVIDGRLNGGTVTQAVSIPLHAGIYELSYVSGAISFFDTDTANGGRTWEASLTAYVPQVGSYYRYGFVHDQISRYATPAQAASAAANGKFTINLLVGGVLKIFVEDSNPNDNRGAETFSLRQVSGPNTSLLAEVRDTMTRSVLWQQREVAHWQSWMTTSNRNCFGCHIQTQASAGLNDSKRKLPDLPLSSGLEAQFESAYRTWQNSAGWVSPFHSGSYSIAQTSLWAWAVSSFQGAVFDRLAVPLINALNWLISQQSSSGGWNGDHDGSTAPYIYYDGAPSATHTAGNIQALARMLDAFQGSVFQPIPSVNITGGTLQFTDNPGNRFSTLVNPVSGVTALRIRISDCYQSAGNFVLNELEVFDGPTLQPIASATANFQQNGYPISESINGIKNDQGDGWAYSPQNCRVTPAVGTYLFTQPVSIDRIHITQIYPDHQLKQVTFEVTTDPSPSSSSVFVPVSITAVGAYESITQYEQSLQAAAGLFSSPTWPFARNVRTAAQTIIGLYDALPYLTGPQALQARNRIIEVGALLRTAQRSDGGWSDATNGTGTSRVYNSAQALRALLLIADQGLDDQLLRGAKYLIQRQDFDGAWTSAPLERRLAATTWVEIALPTLFELLAEQYQRSVVDDLTAEGSLGAVDVYWSPIDNAAGYNVYRRTEGTSFQRIATGYTNGTVTYHDEAVVNEVTYYYMVRWVDAVGTEAAESNEASATPFGLECGQDTPPRIESRPVTGALVDHNYLYEVVASDPDANEVLTYSLVAAPSGMSIDPTTGVITWSPTLGQRGSHFVRVRVTDRIGRYASQGYRVEVSEVFINRPPLFVTTPVTTGVTGVSYLYNSRALDPNVGDILTYSIVDGPPGMQISSSTGRLTWVPTAIGTYPVRIRVTDAQAVTNEQAFDITVSQNAPPVITSTPGTSAVRGFGYAYDVNATDPEGGALTYSIVTAPPGMLINSQTGVVIWTPGNTQTGSFPVEVRVRDNGGLTTDQSYTLVVTDNAAPIFGTNPPTEVGVGLTYRYPVGVTDPEGGPLTVTLTQAPQGMTISSSRVITWTAGGVATVPVQIRAVDDHGLVTLQSYDLSVTTTGGSVGGGTGGAFDPQATVQSPTPGSTITTSSPVVATITDPRVNPPAPLQWRAVLLGEGASEGTEIGQGTGPVAGSQIGVIDPTALENDIYELDIIIATTSTTYTYRFPYTILTNLKFGQFQQTVTDFTIPLTGVSIDISRQYRSFDLLPYEFGHGWKLRMPGRVVDSPAELPDAQPMTFGSKVFVTRPDGRRVGFTFEPYPVGFLLPFYQPYFRPDAGVTDILEVPATTLFNVNGSFFELFNAFNPSQYILTTRDRIRYTIEENIGVTELEDANHNRVTFTNGAITHSNGVAITIVRDSAGRITELRDPAGASVFYTYNSTGDLLTVRDRANQLTSYTYDTAHRLLTITDNAGVVILTNTYVNGRLVSQRDAQGHEIQLTYDPLNLEEGIRDRRGNLTTYRYDAQGNPIQIRDALGGVTSATYDGNYNKTSETDPLGHVTTWTFNAQSDLLSKTDPLGHVTTYTYNNLHQPRVTTNPLGQTSEKQYNSFGLVTSERDFTGATRSYSYDAVGNMLNSTDSLGRVTAFTVDGAGRITQAVDALGSVTEISNTATGQPSRFARTRTNAQGQPVVMEQLSVFNGQDKPTEITNPEGVTTHVVYNAQGREAQITDGRGAVRQYFYDGNGNRTRIVHPDLTEELFEYDAEDSLIHQTDRLGRVTTYEYDALKRQTRVIAPDGTATESAYDAAGRLISETDALGRVTQYFYDAAGRKIRQVDPLGHEMFSSYDAADHLISETDTLGRITTYQYDAEGRRTRTIFADGTIQSVAYDSEGRELQRTDELGNVTRYEYNELGNLTAVFDALNGVTRYAYDEVGNRIRQTDANGHSTRYEYDNLGRETRRVLPLGMFQTSQYDPNGNLVQRRDYKAQITTYQYDLNNRQTLVTYPDSTTVATAYEANGLRTQVTDARGVTIYAYSNRDRLVSVTEPDGRFVTYGYDVQGNRTRVQTAQGATNYEFDPLNRLLRVVDQVIGATTYAYDAVGNELSVTHPNGLGVFKSYDLKNRPIRVETQNTAHQVLQSFAYTLDAVGNRLTIADDTGRFTNYVYDDLYRVIEERETTPTQPEEVTSYTYDATGNRLTRNKSGALTNYTYDDNDRLLNAGGDLYEYDNNGNTTRITKGAAISNLGWDAEDRLRSFGAPGTNAAYQYNADGIRVASTVNGTTTDFLLDSNRAYAEVLEERQSGSVTGRYIHGEYLLSQSISGQTSFFHPDALGSTRALSDAAGAITDRYGYSAFGDDVRHTGTAGDPTKYLYTGEQFDPQMGSYYLRSRHYAPGVGRFWSGDKFKFGAEYTRELNRYAYTANSPVNWGDPSGKSFIEAMILRAEMLGGRSAAIAATGRYIFYIVQYNGARLGLATAGFFGRGYEPLRVAVAQVGQYGRLQRFQSFLHGGVEAAEYMFVQLTGRGVVYNQGIVVENYVITLRTKSELTIEIINVTAKTLEKVRIREGLP